MGNTIVRSQLVEVKDFLTKTSEKLETFLNTTTLASIGEGQETDVDYCRMLLANMRRLTVHCEEGLESCHIVLQGDPFSKAAAEKTLYKIYYQVIEEFYSPKTDAWFEDSRSAYTGKNAIKYRGAAPESIKKLVQGMEADFQRIREELEYYETDYRTKMLQSK
ncbi:DUF3907 family protein [Bacillus massilinigeriensis]|uniref:DUF3907 family protein n=1 Tax=Bacillus mediterraneensis TaxID=1805474 RepID=UPI0008F8C193|nr:DUF3907 family protein [Bacillus mediterraneensis]